jgi:hypothetical protein
MLFEQAAFRVVSLGCESDELEDKEAVDIVLTAAIWANQMRKKIDGMSGKQAAVMMLELKPFPPTEAFCAWETENKQYMSKSLTNSKNERVELLDSVEILALEDE